MATVLQIPTENMQGLPVAGLHRLSEQSINQCYIALQHKRSARVPEIVHASCCNRAASRTPATYAHVRPPLSISCEIFA